MTTRQIKIIKSILEALNLMDGGQMNEVVLHAEVCLRVTPNATKAEFDDALRLCDDHGWLIGVVPKFGGPKLWNLSDLGQATRLEMRSL
jgi:hypothetical protein